MELEHPLLAVEGDEELGLDQGVDDFQLLLAGVARHMEGQVPLVHHLYALAVELVDHIADGVLITGNGGGGDDDPVAGEQVHLPVGVEGHPGEGGHSLPLAAGGDDAHPVLGQGFDVVQVHEDAVGDVHIAQLRGHPHHILHRPAGDGHLAPIPGGHVDDLLNAVHVGGEGGDDDPLLAAPEEGVEGGAHAAL